MGLCGSEGSSASPTSLPYWLSFSALKVVVIMSSPCWLSLDSLKVAGGASLKVDTNVSNNSPWANINIRLAGPNYHSPFPISHIIYISFSLHSAGATLDHEEVTVSLSLSSLLPLPVCSSLHRAHPPHLRPGCTSTVFADNKSCR